MNRGVTRRQALRVSPVLLAGVTAATLAAEPEPNMEAALRLLREALASLEKSASDKGGHRVKAMDYVKRAMSEIQAGIAYANSKR